jgi:dedicated sortase system histidine kinase
VEGGWLTSQRPFHRSIRFKLLLVSLTLLVIPWAGYRYIQETETFLRNAQAEMLLGTAQAVATVLHNREEMFPAGVYSPDKGQDDPFLYLQPLETEIQVDGYTEEWQPYLRNLRQDGEDTGLRLESLIGERGGYLYLLLRISDDRILYQSPGETRVDRSDRIELVVQEPGGGMVRYTITTTSPGWVNASRMPAYGSLSYPQRSEVRIQGEWQERADGYTVELRIPRYLVGERISIGVADVDDPAGRDTVKRVSTAPLDRPGELGWLITANPEVEQIIGRLEHEAARIWVLDRGGRVLARRGLLKAAEDSADQRQHSLMKLLFRLVLDQPTTEFADEFSGATRLRGMEIDSALGDKPRTRRRPTPEGKAMILSAAWPVHSRDGVMGVVLVEQTTNRILSLQNEALEQLFGITLVLFAATGVILLGFATLLSSRIRRLHEQVEEAVSPDGRIRGSLKAGKAGDEIGDLGRSFSGVLDRLAEYNRYLEAMASRLAHELRTPLTVVKSSLENLEHEAPPEPYRRYLERAQQGTERLNLIIRRMREATRLEQVLAQTDRELFDLAEMLRIAVENYRSVYPGFLFEPSIPTRAVDFNGAPDLLIQALDKLVGNAVDFHMPGTPIRIALALRGDGRPAILISNQGPLLPEGMEQELFQSMVSVREKQNREPHLGLGLYLVRIIAEFHGGSAELENLPDGSGVRAKVYL